MGFTNIDKILLYILWSLLWIVAGFCLIQCQQEVSATKEEETVEPLIELLSLDTLAFTTGEILDTRDQTLYRWMQYGNGQKWMRQNLSFKTKTSTCYNRDKSCPQLGQLYQWKEAMNACPKGWKLPSQEDWDLLIQYFGGERNAYQQFLKKSGLAIAFTGVYDKEKKKYSYKSKNGNYWTSTSNNRQAWQYNFSKDYQKIFALQESKELFFSCRCIEGEKVQRVVANKETKKTDEVEEETVYAQPFLESNKPIEKIKTARPIQGIIQFEFYNTTNAEKLLLPIIKREQLSAADLILGKPKKRIKTPDEDFTSSNALFGIQHSGAGYCYGFLIEENKKAQLIHPLPKKYANNSDQADLIISKPKSKKIEQVANNPTHLILENTNTANYTNKKLVICLVSTPVKGLEEITSLIGTGSIESIIAKVTNKQINLYKPNTLTIAKDDLKYNLLLEDQQAYVFTLSIKE